MAPMIGIGVGPCFPGSTRVWTPATDSAVMWVDMARGHYTDAGGGKISAVTDESGNGHNWSQANVNWRATLGTAGPGGVSLDFDNDVFRYDIAVSLGAGTDHTFVVGGALNNVPATTHNNAGWGQLSGGTPYFTLATGGIADNHMGVNESNAGTFRPSSLTSPAGGTHSWIWVVDGAAAQATCYLDGVAAAAPVTCTAFSCGTTFQIGSLSACYPPDGKLWKVAYWNSKLSAAVLAKAHMWAVR